MAAGNGKTTTMDCGNEPSTVVVVVSASADTPSCNEPLEFTFHVMATSLELGIRLTEVSRIGIPPAAPRVSVPGTPCGPKFP